LVRPITTGMQQSGMSKKDIGYLQHVYGECLSKSIATFSDGVSSYMQLI
jgi:hypothetical protein